MFVNRKVEAHKFWMVQNLNAFKQRPARTVPGMGDQLNIEDSMWGWLSVSPQVGWGQHPVQTWVKANEMTHAILQTSKLYLLWIMAWIYEKETYIGTYLKHIA